jgi:hypothetical protein
MGLWEVAGPLPAPAPLERMQGVRGGEHLLPAPAPPRRTIRCNDCVVPGCDGRDAGAGESLRVHARRRQAFILVVEAKAVRSATPRPPIALLREMLACPFVHNCRSDVVGSIAAGYCASGYCASSFR